MRMIEFVRNHKRQAILMLAVVLAVGLVTGSGVTVAKYVREWQGRRGVTAQTFRFTSDYLTDAEIPPQYTVYGNSVTFAIRNHDGLNVTDCDIKYTISTTGGTLDPAAGEKTLAVGATDPKAADDYTLTAAQGATVTVTATSSFPYEKTLTATFTFAEDTDGYYTVENGGNHVLLDIYTGTAGKTVTVNYGSLLPDNTNERMPSDWDGTLTLDPHSHYQFVFFKADDTEYTEVENGELTDTIDLTQK